MLAGTHRKRIDIAIAELGPALQLHGYGRELQLFQLLAGIELRRLRKGSRGEEKKRCGKGGN